MQRDLIYDVGMHRAEDTDFYLEKGFRVVAIEAMPELCRLAAARFPRQVQRRDLTIINGAVSEGASPVTFYVNPNSEWGTIRRQWADRNERLGSAPTATIEVPVVSLPEVFAIHGIPYYLKVDIEGADMLCLKALADAADRPRYLSIESNKTSWRGLVAEFDALRDLGYTRFKIVAQHRVPDQACPNPSREGGFSRRSFVPGSSGLFGEEVPGRWLGRRAALALYWLIFLRYLLYGDDGLLRKHWTLALLRLPVRLLLGSVGWYDTHARREV